MQPIKDVLRELKVLEVPFEKFNTNDLPNSPSELFMEWLNLAIDKDIYEPHKMTVSTIDKEDRPDARILLLKNIVNDKWCFATSSTSRKGKQLALNPSISLTFYWSELGRQVRILGKVSKMSSEASSMDFLERSSEARAIALIGNQSKQLLKQKYLDEAFVKSKELINGSPNTIYAKWTLYGVEADMVEFWQGDFERKHTRVQYFKKNNHWKYQLLWP